VAIARAILRDAPILILDEPTAALDVEAEVEVMRALSALIVGRTVLTISHRLSTVGNVDEILVLHDGQIVEQGTFRQLKQKKGLFAKLVDEQNRYNPDRDDDDSIIRSPFTVTSAHLPALRPGAIPHTPALLSATVPSLPVVSRLSETASSGPPGLLTPVLVPASHEGNEAQAEPQKGNDREQEVLKKDDLKQRQGDIPIQARVLVEIDGETVGEYQLTKPIITIGRSTRSDIQISSQRVSRFHAIMRWKNEAWVIEDAESLNGLSYQGQRVYELALVDGDRISLDPSIVLEYRE
jgi:hypothetical protein